MSERVDELLHIATDAGDIPGVVAMAATASDVVYAGAFGRRWLPDGPPMTLNTIFWIASMTKAITTAAAMQLVERGELNLDAPVGAVLPELSAPQVLEGFNADGKPALRPARQAITLRYLLAHTSGFGYHFLNPNLLRYLEVTGTPDMMTGKNAALNLPLSFDPGTQWEYGIGIDWAGKAIEKVSGQNLQAFFEENLFEPLGMRDTGFELTDERRSRFAGMHARQPDGGLEHILFEMPPNPEFQMGGGGLYGTAADYLAFAQLFLREGRCNGTQLLRPETVKLMGQNHIGDLQVPKWKTAMPNLSNDADFFPGMVKKWGLSFMINTAAVPGGRSANSLAWAGLFNTYYWIDPVRRVAGLIMTQILPFADPKVLELFERFEKAIYAAL